MAEKPEISRGLLDSIGDLVAVYDKDRNLLYANKAFCSAVGYSLEELLGRPGESLLYKPYAGLVSERTRRLSSEGSLHVVSALKKRSGGVIYADTRCDITSMGGKDCIVCISRPVTGGAPAAAALVDSQERYRRLVEGIKGEYFFYQHGTDGVFTYVSPSVTDVLGYTHQDFLKHYASYLTDHTVNRKVELYTRKSIRGIRQPPYMLQILHKDGSPRWLEVLEAPVKDEFGKVAFVEGIAHDVTERVRLREKLESYASEMEKLADERAAELKAIFDRAPVILILVDKDLNVVRSNTGGAPALVGEVMRCVNSRGGKCGRGANCGSCRLREISRYTLASGKAMVHEEAELYMSDARKTSLLVSTALIESASGLRMLLCLEDITAQKAAEDSFRRAEEFGRMILHSSGDGIIGVDTQGRLLFMNSSSEAMLGWRFSEIKGKAVHDVIHSRRSDGSPYPLKECPAFAAYTYRRKSEVQDEVFWKKDGTPLRVRYSAMPIFREGSLNGAVITFTDISERLAVEQERDKLQSLKDFLVQSIVHDLKNPLASIILAGQLLEEDGQLALDDTQRGTLTLLNGQAREMRRMVMNILDISRLEEGKLPVRKDWVDPCALLQEVAEAVRMLVKAEGKKVSLRCKPGQMIKGDRTLLARVLENLVANAIKFSPEGETVEIGYRTRGKRGSVEFYVRDKGEGIPEPLREKIFDKYVQLESPESAKWSGKGLGLAFCRLAVEAHGGRIWADSPPSGRGGLLRFEIPRPRPSSE